MNPVEPLSEDDIKRLRESCEASGVPEFVEDEATLRKVAVLVDQSKEETG